MYSKPFFAVEMFAMAQVGARDCADSIPKENLTSNDPSTCVWDLGGGETVFVAGSACKHDGEQMGFACYNNPSEGNYIFRS